MDKQGQEAVLQLIRGGELSGWRGGPWCREFEASFSALHGYPASVAVNSGTSALHCAYLAADLRPGDEIVISAASYVSAVSAAAQAGATIVICDIHPDTLSLDPEQLRRCISRRTKVVVPVHLWGLPSDMSRISEVAAEHNVQIIEDCAQSLGAQCDGRPMGTFSAASAFSFAPLKLISTGHGGMVLCSTEEIAERARRLANKGKGTGWHDYLELGYSYAMPEFEAIAGLSGLRQLEFAIRLRRRAAEIYKEVLAETDITFPLTLESAKPSYYKVPVQLPERLRGHRTYLLDALALEHIGARLTHPPLLTIPWVAKLNRQQKGTPVADRKLPLVIELESGPNMTEEDMWVSALGFLRVYRHVSARDE